MRKVVDQVVRQHPRFPEVVQTEEYRDGGFNNEVLNVGDKLKPFSLSKKAIGYKVMLVDLLKTDYNRIDISEDICTLELPTGSGNVPKNNLRMMKALLLNCVNPNAVYSHTCGTVFQHVFKETVSGVQPTKILEDEHGATLEEKLLYELSSFYVEQCTP